MFDAAAEHSPMTGLDEYLIHNYPQPVRVMWTSDPRAYERLWFTVQDRVGELLVMIGLGFYPNLNTAEAYAIVNHRGKHTTVRAHRSLGDDRFDMRVGPINFEVVEPFKEWRLTLAENAYGISFDIRWLDTKRAMFHRIAPGYITNCRVGGETAGYERSATRRVGCRSTGSASNSRPPPISARVTTTGACATASVGAAMPWVDPTRCRGNGSSSPTGRCG